MEVFRLRFRVLVTGFFFSFGGFQPADGTDSKVLDTLLVFILKRRVYVKSLFFEVNEWFLEVI